MEDIKNENIPQLTLKSKSQLHYGIDFSHKISELRVFIYGLRGVSNNKNNKNNKIKKYS